MVPLQTKQKTMVERLSQLVDAGKQQLRKGLAKEIKPHLDEVLQAAHRVLTIKHKADLDQAREELKALQAEQNKLASEFAADNKLVEQVNKLTGK